MRFWNDWADEHWDMVALGLAFMTALAFAASLALAFNAFTTRLTEREPAAAAAVVIDEPRGALDPSEP
jgi:uncharacterized BrkB/YihY/UPF0761 family membrane protein